MKFVVKNLAAEEKRYEVSARMRTLGHLRWEMYIWLGVPECKARFVVAGRTYKDYPDSYLLTSMLRGTEEGPNQERLVFVVWMRRTDCIELLTGWMFLESEEDEKEAQILQRMDGACEIISLRMYAKVIEEAVAVYKGYMREGGGQLTLDERLGR